MDLSIIASSFVLLFLAEMGDKTQLMAMTLAHRYRLVPVIAGVLLAFLVLNLLAVLVGEALFRYVPQQAVLLAAGLLFLFFAWRSWLDSNQDEDEAVEPTGGKGAFLNSFVLIFVAELGDKTQIAMVALIAGTGQAWSVFVGGTLALWAVSLIGIAVGSTVLRRVPKAWMHRTAAALFLVFGVIAIVQALR
jgi:putative Ca2+/H+ antiporter (TMEM165/GDT1 family)